MSNSQTASLPPRTAVSDREVPFPPSGLTVLVHGTGSAQAGYRVPAGFAVSIQLDDPSPRGTGDYWNLKRPSFIRRTVSEGISKREVTICIPRSWIEAVLSDCTEHGMPLPDALLRHRSHGSWQPSRHALSLAEQLAGPASDLPMLQTLATESKAMEIAREALRAVLCIAPNGDPNSDSNSESGPMTLESARAKLVRDFILAHPNNELTLPVIAERLGMSIGSMQSAFKATHRKTIGAYIRERRLLAARDAIELEGKRVSEAAYLAGYDNPGSFSTAFRKQFGFPPSNCRR